MMLRMLSDRITGFCATRADVVAMPNETPSAVIVCFEERQRRYNLSGMSVHAPSLSYYPRNLNKLVLQCCTTR